VFLLAALLVLLDYLVILSYSVDDCFYEQLPERLAFPGMIFYSKCYYDYLLFSRFPTCIDYYYPTGDCIRSYAPTILPFEILSLPSRLMFFVVTITYYYYYCSDIAEILPIISFVPLLFYWLLLLAKSRRGYGECLV